MHPLQSPWRLFPAVFLLCAGLARAEVHVDEIHGFKIDVPAGWTATGLEQEAGTFVLFLAPPRTPADRGVTVRVLPVHGVEDPAELVRLTHDVIEDREELSGFEPFDRELLGRKAPGLRALYRHPLGEYRLALSFLVEGERAYELQRHAPREEFEALLPEYEAVIETFAFVEAGPAALEEAHLFELAARCGSEVPWAETWAQAAERARREQKLVLVVAHLFPGFAITDSPRTSTFADREVIEVVNERFVPLWYQSGLRAPFVERYGLSATAFGEALLCVTPDGDVLHETHEASNPDVALPFLLEVLARHPEVGGADIDPSLAPISRAARHVARGEHAAARELLKEDRTAEACQLRARMLAREHDGSGALAELSAARAAGPLDPERAAGLDVLEASLRAREGELARAIELLDRVIGERSGTAAAHEARVARGMLDLPGHAAEARERWRALALEAPESPFAWQAAALLRSTYLGLGLAPEHGWPRPEALAEVLTFPERAPLPAARADEAAKGALAWLLGAQLPDGSWLLPSQISNAAGLGQDPFVDSVAALAGRALLARGKESPGDEARAAAGRALAFVRASIARRAAEPPVVLFMDYATWSDSMALHFLADARAAGLAGAEELAPAAGVLLADLGERQQAGGGWSYYVTSDVGGAGAPANSISFTTAAAVSALCRARDVGFAVPDELLLPAVGALERMRAEDGTFAYFLFHDGEAAPGGDTPAGAAGRGPGCELALRAADKSTAPRLRTALEGFLEHRRLFAAEQGKVLMHAGPDAQGCHYLLFDVAHAALAHQALDGGAPARAKVRELVLACRQPDGSFLDTPVLGRSYGTAMALLALRALE